MMQLTDLDVYKSGEQVLDMVWHDYDSWWEKAQRTIGYQIIRSLDSISINIAEGYGRYSPADRKTFYRYARGAFEGTKGWLRKAPRRHLIDQDRMHEYQQVIDVLGLKLNAFINSINKNYGN